MLCVCAELFSLNIVCFSFFLFFFKCSVLQLFTLVSLQLMSRGGFFGGLKCSGQVWCWWRIGASFLFRLRERENGKELSFSVSKVNWVSDSREFGYKRKVWKNSRQMKIFGGGYNDLVLWCVQWSYLQWRQICSLYWSIQYSWLRCPPFHFTCQTEPDCHQGFLLFYIYLFHYPQRQQAIQWGRVYKKVKRMKIHPQPNSHWNKIAKK